MKRLWINGKASDDREERMEMVTAHCERCYDDKDETADAGRTDNDTEETVLRPGLEGRSRSRSTECSEFAGR